MRHEDRQCGEGQHDEEQRHRPHEGTRARPRDAGVGDGSGYQVGGRERRRDHEPVTHVCGGHLAPREAAERQPRQPPGPSLAPAGAGRGDQEDCRPCERSGERQRDRDRGGRQRHREDESTGRRGDPTDRLHPQEREQSQPGEERVEDDERAEGESGRQRREQEHGWRVQPPALRVGGEAVSRHLVRVPDRDPAGGDGVSEERPAREPEREEVRMLVGESAADDETSEREEDRHDDQSGSEPDGRAPRPA